jgi:hypothetical protein
MKSIYKKLSVVTTILFISFIIYSAYLLYILPDTLVRANVLNMLDIPKTRPVLGQLNFILGLSGVLGLVSIILLIVADNSYSNQNVVYVEGFKGKNGGNGNTETSEAEEDTTTFEYKKKKSTEILETYKNNPKEACDKLLSFICKEMQASTGAIYVKSTNNNSINFIELYSSFAFIIPESKKVRFEFGEGLAGQVAKSGKLINIQSVPEGYIKIFSGLGEASPNSLIIIPIIKDNEILGVAEIASFKTFKKKEEAVLQEIFNIITEKVNLPLLVFEESDDEITVES